PGDPVRMLAGQGASAETIDLLRRDLGLDQSLPAQYWGFLTGLLQGDLGTSFLSRRPVLQEVTRTLPATIELALVAMLLACGIGIPLGIATATSRRAWLGQLIRVTSLVGIAVPVYWLGLLLIYVFSVELGVLPASG